MSFLPLILRFTGTGCSAQLSLYFVMEQMEAFDENEERAKDKRVSLAQSDERMTVQRIDTLVTWYVLLMRDF